MKTAKTVAAFLSAFLFTLGCAFLVMSAGGAAWGTERAGEIMLTGVMIAFIVAPAAAAAYAAN